LTTLQIDLGRQWRGGQSQAYLLATGLSECGHTVEIVGVSGSPFLERARCAGMTVHGVGPRARRLQATLLLRRLLATRRFDIVHAHEPHALTAAVWAGASGPSGLVAARRVAYPLSRSAFSRLRYVRARRIVAVSNFVRDSVIASGFPPAQVEVVYDGVPLPRAAEMGERALSRKRWMEDDRALLLGCVGCLLPEKGQDLLIRALPLVRRRLPGCRLLLAGDGPSRAGLERLARECGVGEAVRFAGWVEDIADVYRAMDVFLFPSVAEPLGSSLLAAMAHGLPVVARRGGAVPEVIAHGSNGLMIDGADPAALAAAVINMADDPAIAERLGRAARQTIERSFSAERMVANTVAVYRRVCEGGTAS